MLKSLLMSIILCFTFSAFAKKPIESIDVGQADQGQTYSDKDGFVRCFENNDKVYFFHWDFFINTELKQVSYFEKQDYIRSTGHFIKNCSDQKYIHDIPNEISKPLLDSGEIFPKDILFALNQVAVGAKKYRTEKTASEFIDNHQNLFQPNRPTKIENLRNDYGTDFATDLMSTWSKKLISPNQSCEKYIGTCDFYLCQELKSPCGLDGYNLSYGFKYCSGSKFTLSEQMQTDLDQTWVTNVFQCLQKKSFLASEKIEVSTCKQIESEAFSAHSNCYVEAGFCELKMSEKLKIFKLIKKEIFSSAVIQQGRQLLDQCHLKKQELDLFNNELNAKDFL